MTVTKKVVRRKSGKWGDERKQSSLGKSVGRKVRRDMIKETGRGKKFKKNFNW